MVAMGVDKLAVQLADMVMDMEVDMVADIEDSLDLVVPVGLVGSGGSGGFGDTYLADLVAVVNQF